jgi:hypothetical protein
VPGSRPGAVDNALLLSIAHHVHKGFVNGENPQEVRDNTLMLRVTQVERLRDYDRMKVEFSYTVKTK